MERIINKKKFQVLSPLAMAKVDGGKNVILHHNCVGDVNAPVSETLVGYSWINRVFSKHTKNTVKYHEYDEAYGCPE